VIQDMLGALDDPHSRHALLVHFPIVLGALGLVPVLALAVRKFRWPFASAVCVAWFAAAMLALGLASGAGEDAYERVEASLPPLSQAEHDALEEHESLGEGAWLWALPAVVLAACTLVPRERVRVGAGGLLIAAAGALTGFVAVAGHTGGALVYQHGLGTPPRATVAGQAPEQAGQAPSASPDNAHDRPDNDNDGDR